MLDGQHYSENLLYWIGQSSADDGRIGDKIYIKNIAFKFNTYDLPTNTSGSRIFFKAYIIKCRDAIRSGSFAPSLTATALPAIVKSGTVATNAFEDTERFTFVKKKSFSLPYEQIANQGRWLQTGMTLSLNKNIQYDGDNSGYVRNSNYYFVIVQQAIGNVVAAANVGFDVNVKITYKDI